MLLPFHNVFSNMDIYNKYIHVQKLPLLLTSSKKEAIGRR